MANIFTQDQAAEIGNIISEQIAKAMGTPVSQPQPQHNLQEIHKDPAYLALIDAKKEIIKQLANPQYLMVRGGRNKGLLINQTKEALVTVNNEINEMFQGSTRIRI